MALPRLCLGVTADGSCAEDCFIEQRELSRYKRRRLRVKTGREEEADELLTPTDGRGGDITNLPYVRTLTYCKKTYTPTTA